MFKFVNNVYTVVSADSKTNDAQFDNDQGTRLTGYS